MNTKEMSLIRAYKVQNITASRNLKSMMSSLGCFVLMSLITISKKKSVSSFALRYISRKFQDSAPVFGPDVNCNVFYETMGYL